MALQLDIVTPEMRALSVQCDEVRLPGKDGGFGVLPGHTRLLSLLREGELFYSANGAGHTLSVGDGFCSVGDDKVSVLVERAVDAKS